jgi:hypothetical protein
VLAFNRGEGAEKETAMTKIAWKMLGLAALVAGSVQLATMGGGAALTLPAPTLPSVNEAGPWNGQLEQVAQKKKYNKNKSGKKYGKKSGKKYGKRSGKKYGKKSYNKHWKYSRHRHGQRYRARRHGFVHFYGGYWYARPWWTIQVPVPVPYYGGGNAHVQYCLDNYNSYNPATDMFFGYDGYYHRCQGSY